jgi:hypothetical protein
MLVGFDAAHAEFIGDLEAGQRVFRFEPTGATMAL